MGGRDVPKSQIWTMSAMVLEARREEEEEEEIEEVPFFPFPPVGRQEVGGRGEERLPREASSRRGWPVFIG